MTQPTLKQARLIAAVGLTAAASAQAQTNVTLYGLVDVSVRHASHVTAKGDSLNTMGDALFAPSRLGVRGSEDLGGGYKGIFLLEQGIEPSSGTLQQVTSSANYGQGSATSGRAWGREAWVGLATPYGNVTLGRQYTLAHQLSGRFQPFPNPNLDAISAFSVHHVARQDNVAKYTYNVGPTTLQASVTAAEGNGKSWSVGGGYQTGPVDVVGYYEAMDSFNGAETRKILGLGGSYAFTPTFKAMLGYMHRSQRVSAQSNDVLSLGINWQVTGAVTLMANLVQDKQSHVGIGKRKMAYVAADYAFSKRTGVYVEIDRNELTGAYPTTTFMALRGKQVGVSSGIRHRF